MTEQQELFEKVGEQLRAKILSKFQTSAFLAMLAVSVLGVQLSTLSDDKARPPLFWISIALMFGALLVYIAALIKLDELTMPKRFWKPDSKRPRAEDFLFVLLEDQDLWELQRRMIFYWYTLTLTATAVTGLALFLLLVPQTWVPKTWGLHTEDTLIAVLGAVALTMVYFRVLAAIARGQSKLLLRLKSDRLRRFKFGDFIRSPD
jgi:hypothetical protein